MKTLSLKQPFVELILKKKKVIELRKWNTKFRGEFLIHSSKILDKESMENFDFKELPCGFILGKARLINVKKYKNKKELEKDKDKHLADSSWGMYGFILKDVKRVKPIPAKGSLGFWNFTR